MVATPVPDHLPTALALAEAGIPTLIEKPLAMDPGECDQIVAAFARAGVPAAVGHVERFHTAVRELHATLAGGDLGPVVRVATRREGGPPRRRDGGVLLDLGTHDFDLTRWLTGLSHDEVTAHSADDEPGGRRRRGRRDPLRGAPGDAPGQLALSRTARAGSRCAARAECSRGHHAIPAPSHRCRPSCAPSRDLVLGRLDPADARASASLSDGRYAVMVATRAVRPLADRATS